MSGGIGRSTASAGEQNVNDVDEQSQGPGCISRSTVAVSGGRSMESSKRTAPQTIRQVNGVGGKGQQHQRAIEGSKASMRSTRSVAPARGQQVRGVGKQVGVLGVGSKVGCPRRERTIDRSTISASKWEVPGVRRDRQVHGIGR